MKPRAGLDIKLPVRRGVARWHFRNPVVAGAAHSLARVTTRQPRWRCPGCFQRRYPQVKLREDRIVVGGAVWTSAGMSTLFDLALAFVEDDLGRETSRAIARHRANSSFTIVAPVVSPNFPASWS